jgi:pimeloyl-ACP methyl ester carboxylesterase
VGVNGDLWRKVAPELAADGHRCIVPDLPLGAHSIPLRGEPDMSLPGLADILASFVDALDLRDATLIANDTGVRSRRRTWAAIRTASRGSSSRRATPSTATPRRRSPT